MFNEGDGTTAVTRCATGNTGEQDGSDRTTASRYGGAMTFSTALAEPSRPAAWVRDVMTHLKMVALRYHVEARVR